MFRKTDDHKRTASVSGNTVTIMFDDGWDDLLDSRHTVASEAEGRAMLIGMGFEEYDPNAHLKAMGLVWRDGCYQRPLLQPECWTGETARQRVGGTFGS